MTTTTDTKKNLAQECLETLQALGGYQDLTTLAGAVNAATGRSVQGRHVAQALARLPIGTTMTDDQGRYAASEPADGAPAAAAEPADGADGAAEPAGDANPLLDMTIDDLAAKYAAVFGKPTASLNRRYLLHRLGQALREKGEIPRHETNPLTGSGVDDLQAKYQEVFGRPTTSTDRRYLLFRISQGQRGIGVETKRTANDLLDLTIEALAAKYLEVVGRPTTSTNRRYLLWKISQASQGKVTTGPATRGYAEGTDFKVIPFRIPTATADTLDAAWKMMGFATRMDFLRAALRDKLAASGAVRTIDGIDALLEELEPTTPITPVA